MPGAIERLAQGIDTCGWFEAARVYVSSGDRMIEVEAEPCKLFLNQPTELSISVTNVGPGTCTDIRLVWQIPVELVLLRGQRQWRIARLAPGEVYGLPPLQIRAKKAGVQRIRTISFTYCDPQGKMVEAPPAEIALLVESIPDVAVGAAPQLMLTWQQIPLVKAHWSVLTGELHNTGQASARRVLISLTGQVECSPVLIPEVPTHASVAFNIHICPQAAGAAVPVVWEISFESDPGSKHISRVETDLVVEEPSARADHIFVAGDWLESGAKKVGGDEISGAGQKGDRVEIRRSSNGGVRPTFCSQCGSVLPSGARFCPECGQAIIRS